MKLLTLLAVVAAFLLAPARADAITVAACPHADSTPGVVTRWEFHHVTPGMTRHQVTCMYGVKGHAEGSYWGADGWWHQGIAYPTRDGNVTDVVFSEHPPGHGPAGIGALHAWHWTWYGDPAESLPF